MIIDANVILRYLRDDIPEQTNLAEDIVLNNHIFLPVDVLAEVVYVLEKEYKYTRKEIFSPLVNFISLNNIHSHNKSVIYYSFWNTICRIRIIYKQVAATE
jgi:predicted nucleic-acid-binding protein